MILHNTIPDPSLLSGLVNLHTLILGWNDLEDLSSLSNLVNLQTLSIVDNNVEDLSPLIGLANLQMLRVASNAITDLSPLLELANLQRVEIPGNPVLEEKIQTLIDALPDCEIQWEQTLIERAVHTRRPSLLLRGCWVQACFGSASIKKAVFTPPARPSHAPQPRYPCTLVSLRKPSASALVRG